MLGGDLFNGVCEMSSLDVALPISAPGVFMQLLVCISMYLHTSCMRCARCVSRKKEGCMDLGWFKI